MNLLAQILGSSLGDWITKLVSQFKMDPAEKAQLQQQLQLALIQNQEILQKAEDDTNVKLNDIAGQNIRAEATNGDAFTERARPAVIWVGLGMFCWNYCLVPTVGLHWHIPAMPIPDLFMEIWGAVVTGYVFNRTVDKLMSLPGDSQVKLPFGIQIGNSSPKQ